MLDTSLIDYFLNVVQLTNDQNNYYLDCIKKQNQTNNSFVLDEIEKNSLKRKIISMLPIAVDDSTYFLHSDVNARTIIAQIFDKNVDDDTLIITTDVEHDSVNEILKKYNNVCYLAITNCRKNNNYNIKFDNAFFDRIKKFKKVFVYCIGTLHGSGAYIPQSLFKTLRQQLQLHGIEFKIALDAAQELFMFPRDYSIYDYIIGTVHAIIPNYCIGLMLSNDSIFQKINSSILPFTKLFEYVQSNLTHINQFSYIINNTYNILKLFGADISNEAGYLCSIGDYSQSFKPLATRINNGFIAMSGYYSINFRATYAMFQPEDFRKHIKYFNAYLSNVLHWI